MKSDLRLTTQLLRPSNSAGMLDGSSAKRRKLSTESRVSTNGSICTQDIRVDLSIPSPTGRLLLQTGFPEQHEPLFSAPAAATAHYKLNITHYIPAGCLHLLRDGAAIPFNVDSTEATQTAQLIAQLWEQSVDWKVVPHPLDRFIFPETCFLGSLLEATIGASFKKFMILHSQNWIRLQFKADGIHGLLRVYILPDDVARSSIDRGSSTLRKSMISLLGQLDVSQESWTGKFSGNTPIRHLDTSLDVDATCDQRSLLELFNTLNSPQPDPEIVNDDLVHWAIEDLFSDQILTITTPLYGYQKRSAAYMLQRESHPSHVLDPRLQVVKGPTGIEWYTDLSVGTIYKGRRTYEASRGGVLAEEMGSGKTLICLAVISATRNLPAHMPTDYIPSDFLEEAPTTRPRVASLKIMAASAAGRHNIPWKLQMEEQEGNGLWDMEVRQALLENTGHYFIRKPGNITNSRQSQLSVQPSRKVLLTTVTLLVVPNNLVEQWRQQIKQHTIGLKVMVKSSLHAFLPTAEELLEYDILLLSKQRFEEEAAVGGSLLQKMRFKRLIVDEGENFGNSSNQNRTKALVAADCLEVDSRWIVSGTPTPGLGIQVGQQTAGNKQQAAVNPSPPVLSLAQEANDIKKLGHIATSFLKVSPWAAAEDDGTPAPSWDKYMMQPRHKSTGRGNMECLRSMLEGLIVRHRPDDIAREINLPPLHQEIVVLEGSVQDKLSLNMFSMMIVSNAVTSARQDKDYLFHPGQRHALKQLVKNLRAASFHWSGFTMDDISIFLTTANEFLDDGKVTITREDDALLRRAIDFGKHVMTNEIYQVVSQFHEMPMAIENDFDEVLRKAWSMVQEIKGPTVMGASILHTAQKYVSGALAQRTLSLDGFVACGVAAMSAASEARVTRESQEQRKQARLGSSPSKKKIKNAGDDVPSIAAHKKQASAVSRTAGDLLSDEGRAIKARKGIEISNGAEDETKLIHLPADDPIMTACLVATSSAKLSYLIDKISLYHKEEKILFFYESKNTAYYLAQALEVINVQHLIFDNSLSSDMRSQYVATFEQTNTFRVLLMEVSQAAYGLDLKSASRIYFEGPIFSPQVEAQAIKRAHRLGQKKAVFIETLVLKDSLEEVLVKRRGELSDAEHKKCRSILDDDTVYDWIRNPRFIELPLHQTCIDQMARLETPQRVFGLITSDTDAILPVSEYSAQPKGKAKRNRGKSVSTARSTIRTL